MSIFASLLDDFSLFSSGRYLVSGHHSGRVTIWDTENTRPCSDGPDNITQCVKEFPAHADTVNGVRYNTAVPMFDTERQHCL